MNQTFEVKIHKMGSGFYNCKFREPKTGRRTRKRFYSLKEAKDFKKLTESKVLSKGLGAFSDLRISQAMEGYIKNYPGSNVRARKNHFISFVDTFGAYRVNELTADDLRKWFVSLKEDRDLSEKTLSSIRSQFFGFFRHLIEEEHIKVNPLEKVRFRRQVSPRRSRVVLSIEEVKTILENAKNFSPNILYPYLATVAHTGARREEVLNLKRQQVGIFQERCRI